MQESDSDNEGNNVTDNGTTEENILGFKVNTGALNNALNGNYRIIFNDLATETNPVPDDFCCGVSEPDVAQIDYMKATIYKDETDHLKRIAAADKSLGTVIFNRMEEFQSSKATFKALKNAVNHLLVMIELPKVLSESVHAYPKIKKVYGGWKLHMKKNPVPTKPANAIEDETLKAMYDYVPVNDWQLMAQFYVVNTTACGQRGIEAQHELKTENISLVESTFKKGKKGDKNPRFVQIVYDKNKNGSEFFDTVIVCICISAMFKTFDTDSCSNGCPCGIAKRYMERLLEAEIKNLYPSLAKPRSTVDQSKSGMFTDKHKLADSHTGCNTLPKLYNGLNELLPLTLRSEKHFTGHSGKQTNIAISLDSGISPESIALTTNNNINVLRSEYLKRKAKDVKIRNSMTLHNSIACSSDTNPDKKAKYVVTETGFFYPDSSSHENSQSTTDSVAAARYRLQRKTQKENMMPRNVTTSSTSSPLILSTLAPQAQHHQAQAQAQAQHHAQPQGNAPVFNFYNNYNPNP